MKIRLTFTLIGALLASVLSSPLSAWASSPPNISSSIASTYSGSNTFEISGSIDLGGGPTSLELDLSTDSTMALPQTYPVLSAAIGTTQDFSITLEDLEFDTTYYYQLRASNSSGTDISSPRDFTMPDVPSKPVLTSISRLPETFLMRLTWLTPQDNGTPLESDLVSYKIGSAGTWVDRESQPVLANEVQLADILLDESNAGQMVYFKVQSKNAAGSSAVSDEISIQLPSSPTAPTNIVAGRVDDEIYISWDPPANLGEDLVTYSIEYTSNGTSWTNSSMPRRPTETSAIFDQGILGNSYQFRVTATNFLGDSLASSPSIPVSLTTPTLPPVDQPVNTDSPSTSSPLTEISSNPTIFVRGKISSRSLAKLLGLDIPKKAKIKLTISKASRKFCKVKSGKVVGVKAGVCKVTVTIQAPKPKKGKKPAAIRRSVNLQVTKQ